MVRMAANLADAVVVPDLGTEGALERALGGRSRRSIRELYRIPFGADDWRFGPENDPAVASPYSESDLKGKGACREEWARRLSLPFPHRPCWWVSTDSPQTTLSSSMPSRPVSTDPERATRFSCSNTSEKAILDKLAPFAIENPGRLLLVDIKDAAAERGLIAASDAFVLASATHETSSKAGKALRYGALPSFPPKTLIRRLWTWTQHRKPAQPFSSKQATPRDLLTAVQRITRLRQRIDLWAPLLSRIMGQAPKWARAAEKLVSLAASFGEG